MSIFMLAAVILAFVAAVIDWRTGHIPNPLTFGALIAAIVGHAIHGGWTGGFSLAMTEGGFAFLGAVLCAIIPAFLYWKGGMGGGDVKLFAALGALTFTMAGLEAQTYAFIAALFFAPLRLAYEGTLFRTIKNALALLLNPFRKTEQRKEIPEELQTWFRLGPSIFVGILATVLTHWDFQ